MLKAEAERWTGLMHTKRYKLNKEYRFYSNCCGGNLLAKGWEVMDLGWVGWMCLDEVMK